MKNKQINTYKHIAQTGYFGLLLIVPIWHLWLYPPAHGINLSLITLIWFIPLLFPLNGIIQGNPYTFAWSAFLAVLYMVHATVIFYSVSAQRILAAIEFLFATLFYIGDVYFTKYTLGKRQV